MPWRPRIALALALGEFFGLFSQFSYVRFPKPRDFFTAWAAGEALLHGADPYLANPGVFYPLPGLVLVSPIALIPYSVANGIFMAVSAAALAWALMEHGYAPLLGMASAGMLYAAEVVQWTPLFAASVAIPPLAFFFALKPHTTLGLWLARPSWWAIGGGLVGTAVAFAIDPQWIDHWRTSMSALNAHLGAAPGGYVYTAPVLLPGGPLVLLALLRWRRPEARLLIALACLPQALFAYETVPLLLIPRTFRESALFVALSWVALRLTAFWGPYPDAAQGALALGRVFTLLLYLPCTLMVLRRPNKGPVPAWLERRVPAWLRGVAA